MPHIKKLKGDIHEIAGHRERLDTGQAIPEPHVEDDLPNRKWLQRVPRSLHKRLSDLAGREKVSLNQLVTSMLAEGLAHSQTNRSMGYLGDAAAHFWDLKQVQSSWDIQTTRISPKILRGGISAAMKLLPGAEERNDAYHVRKAGKQEKPGRRHADVAGGPSMKKRTKNSFVD
jgi:hypothetical protein